MLLLNKGMMKTLQNRHSKYHYFNSLDNEDVSNPTPSKKEQSDNLTITNEITNQPQKDKNNGGIKTKFLSK